MNDLSPSVTNIFKNIELTESMRIFCKKMRRRLRKDWDAVIGIEGPDPGVGKSCLNIQLAYGIDSENFSFEQSVFYLSGNLNQASRTIEKQFNALKRYAYFMIDEGEDALYKLQWFNVLQQSLNLLYMKERKQNKCTGICIPRFLDFNELFRNYRIKYRIYVIDRGIAVAYIRDSDKDILDPWHVKANKKIKEKHFRGKPIAERTIDDRLEAERKTINYWFDFTFKDLPQDVWDEYHRVRNIHKAKTDMISDRLTNQRNNDWQKAVYKIYNHMVKKDVKLISNGKEMPFNQLRLAEITGMSPQRINYNLRKIKRIEKSRLGTDSGINGNSDEQGQDESQDGQIDHDKRNVSKTCDIPGN